MKKTNHQKHSCTTFQLPRCKWTFEVKTARMLFREVSDLHLRKEIIVVVLKRECFSVARLPIKLWSQCLFRSEVALLSLNAMPVSAGATPFPEFCCSVTNTKFNLLLFVCSKGNIHCCQEIRNFVIQYNIKQQQIAVLAGTLVWWTFEPLCAKSCFQCFVLWCLCR